ncbi:MAG: transcriptional regulator [Sphaerochaetaceae bacterium]|nr:transcriptional regulator [Sphaerochaetaceae bacterium]
MDANISDVIDIFTETTDRREMTKLFEEFFSDSEIADVSKRWYIFKELYQGTSQRKIANEMGVSLCKITRGSKILKQDSSIVREILHERYGEDHI